MKGERRRDGGKKRGRERGRKEQKRDGGKEEGIFT